MRTMFGSVFLTLACLLVVAAVFAFSRFQAESSPASGTVAALALLGWAGFLSVIGLLLLRAKTQSTSGKWVVVASTATAALVGIVMYFMIELPGPNIEGAGNNTYELKIRVFGTLVQQERAPAVRWTDQEGDHTGISQDLFTKMFCWTMGIWLAYVTLASLIGALLGGVICRLTRRST